MRNKFENKIAKQLTKSKVDFGYEVDKLPYVFTGYYLPDFTIISKSGKIFLETKGYFRPEHKRKLLAVKRHNPTLDIRLVFYAKVKGNIRWAEKNGFPYSIGEIPKEWLNLSQSHSPSISVS